MTYLPTSVISRIKELLMKEAIHIDSYPGPQIKHSEHIMGPCLNQQQLNKETRQNLNVSITILFGGWEGDVVGKVV